jgi:hypothetical protein
MRYPLMRFFYALKTAHCMQDSVFLGWTAGLYLGGCLKKWVVSPSMTHIRFQLFSGYFVLFLLGDTGMACVTPDITGITGVVMHIIY